MARQAGGEDRRTQQPAKNHTPKDRWGPAPSSSAAGKRSRRPNEVATRGAKIMTAASAKKRKVDDMLICSDGMYVVMRKV